MAVLRTQLVLIQTRDDIPRVRQMVRNSSIELGFSLPDQTKMMTAASELARNIVEHAGGTGHVLLHTLSDGPRRALRLVFDDKGPGSPISNRLSREATPPREGWGLDYREPNAWSVSSRSSRR